MLLRRLGQQRTTRRPLFKIAVRGAADAKALLARMKVVTTIQTVTRAMKNVAGAKVKPLERAMHIARDFQGPVSELWKQPEGERATAVAAPASRGMVLITSDKGLCGSVNNTLSRKAKVLLNDANNLKKSNPPFTVYTIGKKGHSALDRQYGKFFQFNMMDYTKLKQLQFGQVCQMAGLLMKEPVDEFLFIYNQFKTLMKFEYAEERIPSYERFLATATALRAKYEIESGGYSDVLRDLYEFRFAVRLWHMLSENMVVEMSTRLTAMTNSTKSAGEMLTALQLQYNRTRQAKITTELIEIVSGAAALDDAKDK